MEAQEERRKMAAAFNEVLAKRLNEHMSREDKEKEKKARWHIGKEIPLAILAVFVAQTASVIWWAASTSAKVDFMKESNIAAQIVQTAVDRKQDEERRDVETRLMVVFERVDRKLDRLIEEKNKK